MSPSSPLAVAYLEPSRLELQGARWRAGVLGQVCYGGRSPTPEAADWPAASIHTPRLDAPGDLCEVWLSTDPVSAGTAEGIAYRRTDDLLFGVVTETEGVDGVGSAAPLQCAAERGYLRLFALIDDLGYPSLLRAWNYLAEINREEGGVERYRQFNAGRQDAFLASGRSLTDGVPAACALGAAGQPMSIAFLAARRPGVPIENPRQVSAFHYPAAYGSRSPTFSRATLFRLPGQEVLFLSGTASIGGHETRHSGDVGGQTRETLANLLAVLEAANGAAQGPGFRLESLYLKVYLRDPGDLDAVRAVLTEALGPGVRAAYLRADICRADLLLEIETTAGLPIETP